MVKIERKARYILPLAAFTVVVIISGLCLSACVAENGLRWKQIAAGEGYNVPGDRQFGPISDYVYLGQQPRLIVISDEAAVGSIQDRVLPSHRRRIARTDFATHWVAVVYQGFKCRPGYSVQVSNVELDGDTVIIYAKSLEPTETDCLRQVGTSPYAVVRIQKPRALGDARITFAASLNGEIFFETCALPGEYVPWHPLINDPETVGVYEGRLPRIAVVTEEEELLSVEGVPAPSLRQLAEVNYRERVVGIVFQGRKGTTGYHVEVIHITREHDTIHICAQAHTPRPNQPTGGAVTSPYYAFQFEKTEDLMGEFTFVLTDDHDGQRELARQTHVIH
jgi:hypothetical protein